MDDCLCFCIVASDTSCSPSESTNINHSAHLLATFTNTRLPFREWRELRRGEISEETNLPTSPTKPKPLHSSEMMQPHTAIPHTMQKVPLRGYWPSCPGPRVGQIGRPLGPPCPCPGAPSPGGSSQSASPPARHPHMGSGSGRGVGKEGRAESLRPGAG